MKKYSSTFLFLLFVIVSCGKKDAPVDPCAGAKPFKADFYIQEQVGDSLIKTDKVMQYAFVVFEAFDNYTSFKWKIGDDARSFTDKKVRLLFTDSIPNVSVQLIATRKADPCFPNDKMIDTITKSFSVIPWRKCPLIGTYIGTFQSNKTKIDTVKLLLLPQPDGWDRIALINVNPGCNLDTTISWSTERGAYAYRFDSDNAFYSGCKAPNAWLRLFGNDTLKISYTYKINNNTTPSTIITDQFTGYRKK